MNTDEIVSCSFHLTRQGKPCRITKFNKLFLLSSFLYDVCQTRQKSSSLSKICEKLRVLRRRQWTKNSLRARARLVNHLRRHVSQSVNLFFYLPIVSRGILAGEFFPYSEVFIRVIGSVPNVLRVEERDQAGFSNNAGLFDNKTAAEITDCLTGFKVLCLLIVDIFHCPLYNPFHFYLRRG